MTKSEIREIAKLAVMHKLGMTDTVARGLSALIRATRTKKAVYDMLEYAETFGVLYHPDFKVI